MTNAPRERSEGEEDDWRFRDPEPLAPLCGDDDDIDPLHWMRGEVQARRPPLEAISPPGLLSALSEAEDAISRLDAFALAAPEPVREGLVARVAFREASGWLAHAQAWVHPTDHQREFGERMPADLGENITFEYFVLPEAFKAELCNGFDAQTVARVLLDHGCLTVDQDRLTVKPRLPGIGHARCYHITPALFALDL